MCPPAPITCFIALLLPLAAAAPAQLPAEPAETLARGIVAYYPFDVNAEDASGFHRDATATDQVAFVRGRFGEAARFTAAGAVIQLPFTKPIPGSYTLSGWLYLGPNFSTACPTWRGQPPSPIWW